MSRSDYFEKVWEDVKSPGSWHWKVRKRGAKAKVLSFARTAQRLVSVEGMHVTEVLEELERAGDTERFLQWIEHLGEVKKNFERGGYKEEVAIVQQTIADYMVQAHIRSRRRGFLRTVAIGGGAIILANVLGKELIEMLEGEDIPIRTVEEVWSPLIKPVIDSDFHITQIALRTRNRSFVAGSIQQILSRFDSSSPMSVKDVSKQVALCQAGAGDSSPMNDKLESVNQVWNGQALLLPTLEEGYVFYLTAYHVWEDYAKLVEQEKQEKNSDGMPYWYFFTHPDIGTDMLFPGKTLLAYSKDLDLALGCISNHDPPPHLHIPSFTTKPALHKKAHLVPSASHRNTDFKDILEGQILRESESYLVSDVGRPGYSGSPLCLSDGAIAGCLFEGITSRLGVSVTLKSKHIREFLEFVMDSCQNG